LCYDTGGFNDAGESMTLEGTVVNGVIVPDGGATLPEGSRVRIELSEVYPHPLAPYDREKELALLQERITEMQTGSSGIPLREAMARTATELNLPQADAE
jgi:hypothetical protein